MSFLAGGFFGWIGGKLLIAILMPILAVLFMIVLALFMTIIMKACETNTPRHAAPSIPRECITGYYDENNKWHFPLNSRGRWKKNW